jgi:hypothetical protein
MNNKVMKSLFLRFIKTSLLGAIIGSLLTVIFTLSFPSFQIGLLFSILLIPSIILYITFDFLKPKKRYKDFMFWIISGIIIFYPLIGYILDLLNITYIEIGAKLFLNASIIILTISLIEYYYLKKTGQK